MRIQCEIYINLLYQFDFMYTLKFLISRSST